MSFAKVKSRMAWWDSNRRQSWESGSELDLSRFLVSHGYKFDLISISNNCRVVQLSNNCRVVQLELVCNVFVFSTNKVRYPTFASVL